MPHELTFSVAHFVVVCAVGFLCLLIGALLNQKLTKQRWQHIHDHLSNEYDARIQMLQAQLEDRDEQLGQSHEKVEFYVNQMGKFQAEAERVKYLLQQVEILQAQHAEDAASLATLREQYVTLETKTLTEQTALQDKITLLESTESRLNQQFENLANKIFDDRSSKLNQQNNQQISGILAPLQQQLDGFRKQIAETYRHEQDERGALKHQLSQLNALNIQMSQDAINLTKALKGDNKQAGNWGEVILDRVLQESGLREGHEYDTQTDLKNDQGQRFKPDVIVHLPDNKDVVIDAKLSLVAYERYFNSEDELIQAQAVKQHIQSLKQHIKGLSQKDYQRLHGITSLDYILMFIPIEPAFMLAVEHEPSLIDYALEHNIMLVSPTNLLVALRTINNIWRYEYQHQNAQVIAKHASKIYDKLCGYLEDMDKLGRAIENAERSYNNAMNKLTSGKGNLIRQAHQMQQLGVETSKKIDKQLISQALSEHDTE